MSSDLLMLQNRMKRDPQGYREEFLQQVRHFMSNLQIFKLQPLAKAGRTDTQNVEVAGDQPAPKAKGNRGQSTELPVTQGAIQSRRVQEFCGLISFLSHAAPFYRDEVLALNIPQEIFSLLHQHCEALDPLLRKTLVQAMILLQNRGLVRRVELLPALFRTFRCADKELRKSVFSHIVTDIQKLHKTNPSQGAVLELQKLLFTMLQEDHPGVALKALQVLVELWKRNVWVDEKVVNAISTICFNTDDKLVSAALYFFLGNYDTTEEEDAEKRKDTLSKQKELMATSSSLKHIKRRMKKTREMERKKKEVKKAEKELFLDSDSDDDEDKAPKTVGGNLNPLSLIYDPQHFSERLFSKLKSSRETFATRMLMMEVLSKLIGMHKLLIFNFYPFIQRYLQPHQRHVTQLLAFTARASHSLVPPEVLSPVIKTLANHFVTDRSPPEVMAIGLNAIREICARAPLVMTEDLLHDLSEYSHHKNKGIITAARSLISIFRQLNPSLLRRKDRGREGALALQIQAGDDVIADEARAQAAAKLEYGANYVHKDLDGAQLLSEFGLLDDVAENSWDATYDPENDSKLDEVESDDPNAGKLSKHQRRALNKRRGKALEELKQFYRNKGYTIPGDSKDDNEDDDVREMSLDDLVGDDNTDMEDMEDMEGMTDMEDMESMEDLEDMEEMEDMEDMDEIEEEEEETTVKSSGPVGKVAIKAAEAAAARAAALKRKEAADAKPGHKLGALRILTPADFKRIDALKKKKLLQGLHGERKRQRSMLSEDILAEMDYNEAMVQGSYRDIEGEQLHSQYLKKRRLNKEGRLARVYEGRDLIMKEREYVKFGHKAKQDNLGRSNEEKLKDKNFMMVKNSFRIRSKGTKSFKDKQSSEQKHVKTMRKMSKNMKKNVRKSK